MKTLLTVVAVLVAASMFTTILSASAQSIKSDSNYTIPNWIKNTAGWWADSKIHDIAFVGAVKYLIVEGIMIVSEVEKVELVEEVVEIKDFYMEVNGDNCCTNWTYRGEEYRFQIETFDEKRGNHIDGVEINVKIISKGGELRDNFVVTTEGGMYKGNVTIPGSGATPDWYGENILSVTGELDGVEKTIEKEFSVITKARAQQS